MGSGSGHADRCKRILVIANETAADEALRAEIVRRAEGSDAEVLVVCPVLNTRRRRWFSERDDALAKASVRLMESLAALEKLGIAARGHVGDPDPVRALGDAVEAFAPTEIVVSTLPGQPTWLERLEPARKRFGLPVTHVVVDLERDAPGQQDVTSPAKDDG